MLEKEKFVMVDSDATSSEHEELMMGCESP